MPFPFYPSPPSGEGSRDADAAGLPPDGCCCGPAPRREEPSPPQRDAAEATSPANIPENF